MQIHWFKPTSCHTSTHADPLVLHHQLVHLSCSRSISFRSTTQQIHQYSHITHADPIILTHSCTQIHWFSIINSCVTVLLLTGFLATILLRVLKNDFLKYTR
jgi:hypothetical protein